MLPAPAVDVFSALADQMVELCADKLEEISAQLDEISRTLFPSARRASASFPNPTTRCAAC